MKPVKLKRPTIFISSPSDVAEERKLAKAIAEETIAELLLEYDVYDWKEKFLSGGRTFQQQIPKHPSPQRRRNRPGRPLPQTLRR